MKKIIKSFVCLSLFTSIVGSAFAIEWGGLITEKLTPTINAVAPITSENLSLQNTDDVYLWMNTALNKSKTLNFNSEIKYEFTWYKNAGSDSLKNIIDADLLKLSGVFDITNDKTVSFALGRYPVSDNTGVVFNQVSDGLYASLVSPTVTVSGYLGFTGLLNSLNVSMLDNSGSVESSDGDFYVLAHPYLPANVTVEFPVLFGNQSLSVEANAFIDFKDSYNRYYANLVMSGPISNSTYYKLASSIGSVNFTDLMNYTSFNLIMFPTSNFALTAGAEYASGEHMGLNNFVGFSSRVAYNSPLSPQTTGVIIPNASVTWTYGNSLYTGFSGKFIMAIPGTTVEKTAAEVATDLIYNLFSDLQVGLNLDWYVPVGISDDNQKFSATINVGVSF